jgi:hypothetical protein
VIVPGAGYSGLSDTMKARRERAKEIKKSYRERKKRRGRDMLKGNEREREEKENK